MVYVVYINQGATCMMWYTDEPIKPCVPTTTKIAQVFMCTYGAFGLLCKVSWMFS